jgi:adenosylhomocysteine nucleosidase
MTDAASPGAAPRRRVAVIAAMVQELKPLARTLGLRPLASEPTLYVGTVDGLDVVATASSMGTDAAASVTRRLLTDYDIDHVVGIGIVGGMGPDVAIGDLVVPEVVIDGESGAARYPHPVATFVPTGKLVTSTALINDKSGLPGLIADGVIAVDMETSAIGAVCDEHACPWSVVRAVSDWADDENTTDDVVGMAHPDGRANVPAVVRFVLTRPWRLPHLARLGRGMVAATEASASAGADACRHLARADG